MKNARRLAVLGSLILGVSTMLAAGELINNRGPMSGEERRAAKEERHKNAKRFRGQLPSGVRTDAPKPLASDPTRAMMGTISYDDGVFNSIPIQPVIPQQEGRGGPTTSFGNIYNTHNMAQIPSPTITVTQVSLFPAVVEGSTTASGSAFITLFGPATDGPGLQVVSSNMHVLNPGTWNQVSIPSGTISPAAGPGTRDSFVIGLYASAFIGTGTGTTTGLKAGPVTAACAGSCVGLSTGTVGGQGFHAMYVRSSGFSFGNLSGFNAMMRATGNVVPVELMGFEIQ